MSTKHSDTSWVSGNTSTGSPYLDGTASYISSELQNLEDSVSQAILNEDDPQVLSSRTGTFTPGRDTSGRRDSAGVSTERIGDDTYRSATRQFPSSSDSRNRKSGNSAGSRKSRSSRDTEIISRIRNLESGVSGYEESRRQGDENAGSLAENDVFYDRPARRIENTGKRRAGAAEGRQTAYDQPAAVRRSSSRTAQETDQSFGPALPGKTGAGGAITRGHASGRTYARKKNGKGRGKSRKRRKRLLRRLMVFALLAAFIIGVILLLKGCQTREVKAITRSTVEFRRNGSLIVTSVEPFERDYYDEKELRALIDEALGKYNLNGKKIELNQFDVDNKNAVLQLSYQSSADYRAFNDTMLFDGTVQEAQEQGIDLSAILSAVSRQNSSRIFTAGDFPALSGNRVIVLAEAMDIVLPRREKIMYASANLNVTDDQHAAAAGNITRSSYAVIILE